MTEPEHQADLPVSVSLPARPPGIWGRFRATHRNFFGIIPDLSPHRPVVSGKTGNRWLMLAPLFLSGQKYPARGIKPEMARAEGALPDQLNL